MAYGTQFEGNTVVANWAASGNPPAVFVLGPNEQPPLPPTSVFRNNIAYNLGPGVECELQDHRGRVVFECNNIGFNSGPPVIGECGDVIGQNGTISVDPGFGHGSCPYTPGDFCLAADSPLLPANSPPGCGLIGAVGPCGPIGVEVVWDGRDDSGGRVAGGGYVAVIRAGGREVTRTVLLVR